MAACRELEQKYGLTNAADSRLRQTEPHPTLKKVDHSKGDVKHQISNTLKGVLGSYKFQTFGEYSALLSCYNIEAKQVRGEYEGVPYTGIVYTATDNRGQAAGPPFKSSLFGKQFGHEGLTRKMERHTLAFRQKKWSPKIDGAVRLAMITCRGDRERFEKVLHGKGIDVMFRKNDEGRIYGVTFIDHNAREVYNGSRLGKEFSANAFERLFTEPAQSRHEEQGLSREPSGGLELFGIDITGHAESEPNLDDNENEIQRRKRKKKKRRYISR
jgi:hypothetical protein